MLTMEGEHPLAFARNPCKIEDGTTFRPKQWRRLPTLGVLERYARPALTMATITARIASGSTAQAFRLAPLIRPVR